MSCNFCVRNGFALLPVRPAVVPVSAGAPLLPAQINVPVPSNEQIAYTCRQLRQGYLHVYDEKRKSWTDYIVTEDGYFWKLDLGTSSLAGAPTKVTPCMNKPDEVARSTFITLPLAAKKENNGVFWFGWSDYAWTDEVRKANSTVEVRSKHMQLFDLKAWLDTSTQPQAVSFNQLSNVVAEFSASTPASQDMQFMSAKWQHKTAEAASTLVKTARQVTVNARESSNPAIIVVPDPVGITRDLAELISKASDKFLDQCRALGKSKKIPEFEEFDRKIALNQMINTMAASVKKATEIQNVKLAQQMRESLTTGSTYTYMGSVIIPLKTRENKVKRFDAAVNKYLKNWGGKEWEGYQKFYNQGKQEKFNLVYDKQLSEYNEKYTIKLSDLYRKWFMSEFFKDYFIYNFDTKDINNGLDYLDAIVSCIIGVQQENSCYEMLTKLLSGSIEEKCNPVMRGMVLNQDNIVKEVSLFNPSSLTVNDLSGIPWFSFFAAMAVHFTESGKSIQFDKVMLPLHGALSGPLMKLLSRPLTATSNAGELPLLLGMHANRPMIYGEVHNTKDTLSRQLTTIIITEMFEAGGIKPARNVDASRARVNKIQRVVKESGIADIIENEMRLKIGAGGGLTGEGKFGFLMLMDLELENKIKSGSFNKATTSLQKTFSEMANRYGSNLEQYNFKLSQAKYASAAGFISLLCQGAAIASMIKTEGHWYYGKTGEATIRLLASWTGLIGGTMESFVGLLKVLGREGSSFFKTGLAATIEFSGKMLGLFAGVVMAFCDYYQAFQENKKNNFILMSLYLISGTAGIAFTISCAFSLSSRVALILFVVVIITAFVISYFKPNELQNWLDKTLWGNNEKERFTKDNEYREFNKLFQGK